MKFTIEITDASQLAGLKAAREAANAALSPAKLVNKETGETKDLPMDQWPGYVATDEEYLQARVVDLLNRYAKHHGFDHGVIAALEADLAARKAKMKGLK